MCMGSCYHSKERNSAGRLGFTLIELLVVVAIIGVLAALVVPGLSAARQRTQAVMCAQNLRQIGLGMLAYADSDPDGFLPGSSLPGKPPIGLNPWPTWIYGLSNQIPTIHRLRICPSDALRSVLVTNQGCSYVLNQYTSTDGTATRTVPGGSITGPGGENLPTYQSSRKLDALANPAQTITVFEASKLSQLTGDLQTHPDAWFFGWNYVLADIDPYRHGRGANFLFADNHVSLVPAFELKNRIERGDNFAIPPR
jgi:general secretion pathway protein G